MVPNGSSYTPFPSFADAGTRTEPGSAKYAQGFVPGDTYPAEWANYFLHGSTAGITRLNSDTESIKKELNSILSAYGITNDATVYDQLLTALYKIYPQICTCSTGASTEVKAVSLSGNVLRAGCVYSITMTNGNTYGDGSSTYPKLSFNSGTSYPMCDSKGKYLKDKAWAAGDVITVLFTGSKFLMATNTTETIETGNMNAASSDAVQKKIESLDVSSVGGSGKYISAISETDGKISATATSLATAISYNGTTPPNSTAVFNFGKYITASSKTVTGPTASTGLVIRVLFTSALNETGSATKLQLTYNSAAKNVKVYKNGTKVDFTYREIESTKKYLQAGTTLELMYDGTDFIILGNPVVLSDKLYTIYADGRVGDEPIGAVKAFSSTSTPYGWLSCDGQAASRTKYADLFSVIGTAYGTGDGSTTFNVPDYREIALVGIGTNSRDAITTHDTYSIGEFKDDSLQSHIHSIYEEGEEGRVVGYRDDNGAAIPNGRVIDYLGVTKAIRIVAGTSTAGRVASVTHGKQKGVHYIIKAL